MMDKKSRRRYIFNILLILTITCISLYFSIGKNYQEVFATLRQANVLWIIVMVGMMLGYYLFDSLSLYQFGRAFKKDFKYIQAFRNSLSGIFFSDITPSSSGGQIAQVYVFNKQGINATNASSIVLMCFICHQSVLVVYAFFAVILNLGYVTSHAAIFSLVMLGFVINFVAIAGLFAGARSKRFQNFLIDKVVGFLSKIKIVKNYEATSVKIEDYFADFRSQLTFLQNNRKVLINSCFCNFMKMAILYSLPFFAAKALNLNVSYAQLLQFNCYCSFIYLINAFLPIPGASGGSEACYMLFFSFLGTVGASSSMTLWRFISYYVGLILGGLLFSLDKEINGPGVNSDIKIEDME